MSAALRDLAARLRADGGLLAAATVDGREDSPGPGGSPGPGEVAAEGLRTRGFAAHAAEYALLVEAVHEGYLAHYAQGRVLRSSDPDLQLLGGDRLYALGLDRLAQLGDLESVAILAEVIAGCARAHAEGRAGDAAEAWRAGAAALAARAVPSPSGVGPNT